MLKTTRVIAEVRKRISKKDWCCIIDGCNNKAINSHLIQRNGLLSNIAPNGHLVECKVSNAYNWTVSDYPIVFEKTGINRALSLEVFCDKHDSEIFKPIESGAISLESYTAFLLFGFRALCAEIRKKETNIELIQQILNSAEFKGRNNISALLQYIIGTQKGLLDLKFLKKEFELEIGSASNKFNYFACRYPLVELYASAVFSANDFDRSLKNEVFQTNFENVYIHLLPLKNELLILCGYHNKFISREIINYCSSWENLTLQNLQKKLTTLFVLNIENWGMSIKLFESISPENIELYKKSLLENEVKFGVSENFDFNFFENAF